MRGKCPLCHGKIEGRIEHEHLVTHLNDVHGEDQAKLFLDNIDNKDAREKALCKDLKKKTLEP